MTQIQQFIHTWRAIIRDFRRLYWPGALERELAIQIAEKALGIKPVVSANHDRALRLNGMSEDLCKMITAGICPACKLRTQWWEGPTGGMSTNIRCGACDYWFNISPIGVAEAIGFKS